MRKTKEEIKEVVKEGKYFKFLLRIEPEMYERIQSQALRRFGMTASTYIRLALTERLEKDEISEGQVRKKHIR
jgi:hypothetical protein